MAGEKIQYGLESSAAHGTAVPATTMIVGESKITFKQDSKPIIPADDIGLKVGGYRAVQTTGKLVQNTLSIQRAYFQILPLLFSLLIKGGVTPAEQTTDQDDYLWTFTPDLEESNTPDSATFEHGDGVQAFETEYVTGERLKIILPLPQDGGDAVASIEYDFFSRQNTKTDFTAAINPPTVTEINGLLTKLFIDSLWANAGDTEITNQLRNVEIEILSGNYPEFNGGSQLFSGPGEGKIAVLVILTMVNGAAAVALHDAKGQMKVVRILNEGPAIGTGDKHALDLTMSMAVMDPVLGESKEKETSLTTVALEAIYDVTGDAIFVPLVTTNKATP